MYSSNIIFIWSMLNMSLIKCMKCKYRDLSYETDPCKSCIHNVDYSDNFRKEDFNQ